MDTLSGVVESITFYNPENGYTMLQCNLLYTAITRTRRLYVLAGSLRAIRMAVHKNNLARVLQH